MDIFLYLTPFIKNYTYPLNKYRVTLIHRVITTDLFLIDLFIDTRVLSPPIDPDAF